MLYSKIHILQTEIQVSVLSNSSFLWNDCKLRALTPSAVKSLILVSKKLIFKIQKGERLEMSLIPSVYPYSKGLICPYL